MNQRQQEILDVLAEGGGAPVQALAERLGVTPVTVRRDLNALAREGLVRRVHGSAVLAERGVVRFTFDE